MGRYVRIDRRYNQPVRPTGYAMRVVLKWVGLIFLWIVANSILLAAHVSYLAGLTTAALIGYAVYCIRRYLVPRPPSATAPPATSIPAAPEWRVNLPPGWPGPDLTGPQVTIPAWGLLPSPWTPEWRFSAPPGWPKPPRGWTPPPWWSPDPSWPPAPTGWEFWMGPPVAAPPSSGPGAARERNSRTIPQDVKIAVSARDQGRCVQCGSTQELHYDHKIPWSRGGSNTVNNIQLLCGRCNRIKGADDIPV